MLPLLLFLLVTLSNASKPVVRLGAHIPAASKLLSIPTKTLTMELDQQLNAGANHTSVGFHIIVYLANGPVNVGVKFEKCGETCSNENTNEEIYSTENLSNDANIESEEVIPGGHLWSIKYSAPVGESYTHIRTTVIPQDCFNTQCQMHEESILCPLGQIPKDNNVCVPCAPGEKQYGLQCNTCDVDTTSAKGSTSCDITVAENSCETTDKSLFGTRSDIADAVQTNLQTNVASLKQGTSIIDTFNAVRDNSRNGATAANGSVDEGKFLLIFSNAKRVLWTNYLKMSGKYLHDLDLFMNAEDIPMNGALKTFLEERVGTLANVKVRQRGAQSDNDRTDDTCDGDIGYLNGVLEINQALPDNAVAVICRHGTKLAKSNLTEVNCDTGVEKVETQCWTGSAWSAAETRVTYDTYTCGDHDFFVHSHGTQNNASNCEYEIFQDNNGLNTNQDGCICGDENGEHDICSAITTGLFCNRNSYDCHFTCIAEFVEMQTTRGNVQVRNLKEGDVIKMPNSKTTIIRDIKKQKVPTHALHEVNCNGAVSHLTGNHAYQCNGDWHHPKERGRRLKSSEPTHVYSIRTQDYCNDRLLTSTGIEVEGWDGLEATEYRHHYYENGRRLRCTNVYWE